MIPDRPLSLVGDGGSVVLVRLKDGRERRVSLPAKWWDESRHDYQPWDLLSRSEQTTVVRCITSFPFFLHRCFLPKFCADEQKPLPPRLFPHVAQWARMIQQSVHPLLLPFDVFDDERDERWRICIVAPNRSLKTTTIVYALPLWMIGVNNGIRILVASATKTLADQKTDVTKSHILHNLEFMEVFGELHTPKSGVKWESGLWSVDGHGDRPDQSMTAVGIGGAVEGIGCDIALGDDVQNIESAKTSEARAKSWLWVGSAFQSRLDPVTRLEVIIQTRQAADDIAGRIKEESESTGVWNYSEWDAVKDKTPGGNDGWPPREDDFIDPTLPNEQLFRIENLKDVEEWESRLLCPDVLPLKMLLEEWIPEGGRDAFYRTRMNQVRDPEMKWFSRLVLIECSRADGGMRVDGTVRPRLPAWDMAIGVPEEGSEMGDQYARSGIRIGTRVVSIDTAATSPRPGSDPDWTVIQLWGLDTVSHIRVLLDMWRFRTSSPKVFRKRLRRFVDAYLPHYVIMESNGMAKWGVKDARDEIGYPIQEYNRGRSEVEEVETFKSLMESHLMLYCWGDKRAERVMRPFEDELDDYPSPGSHDDTLIAAVQAQCRLVPRGTRSVKVRFAGPKKQPAFGATADPSSLEDISRMISEMYATLEELESYGAATR